MKKFISICKKVGKILLVVLTVGISLFVFLKVRKAVSGRVKSKERVGWTVVPSDSRKIGVIKKDGTTEIIQLPNGIKFKDVKAVGVSEQNKVTVEVVHEKTDRKRDLGPVRSDNALNAVRSRIRSADKNGGN